MGAVLAEGLLEAVEHRPQPPPRKAHQVQVERCRREEDDREQPVVVEHQSERSEQRRDRGQSLDALLDDEHPHLAHPGQAPLDVAGAPGVEVAHRQVEELRCEEVERLAVDRDGGAAEDVPLEEVGAGHGCEDGCHVAEEDVEQVVVVVAQHPAEDHLGEDRQDHLEGGREERQRDGLGERAFEGAEEVPDPPRLRLGDGRLLQTLAVGEQRGVARPLLFELGAVHASEPARRVCDADVPVVDAIEDDPVVPLEMADRR